jgi:DNA-binding CsgD family transcriptional regulator
MPTAFQESELTRAALVAALDRLPTPSFVVRDDGLVGFASAGARASAGELRAAVAGRADRYASFRLALPSGAAWYLVVGVRGAHLALTPRQREIVALVVNGATNKTIAELLGISERTVEVHLTTIYQRAGIENRASLVSLLLGGP